jgi:plastocyanin
VDRTGKVVVSPLYDWITPPIEGGLWLVMMGDRFGFIDVEGKVVIGPTLDSAQPFSDGLASVRVGERWGFMKPDGKYLVDAGPTYDEARPMRNGRAAVRVGDLWGFIDRKGVMIVSPTYDAVGDFDGDLAAVFLNGMLGYIDASGKLVRTPSGASSAAAPAAAARATPDNTPDPLADEVAAAPATDSAAAPAIDPGSGSAPVTGRTFEVRMIGDEQGYRFEPSNLTIKSGDAVRFVGVSGFPHNVAFSGAGLRADVKAQLDANFGSGRMAELSSNIFLARGEGLTISFGNIPAGKYEFHCTPHLAMGMRGLITVQSS